MWVQASLLCWPDTPPRYCSARHCASSILLLPWACDRGFPNPKRPKLTAAMAMAMAMQAGGDIGCRASIPNTDTPPTSPHTAVPPVPPLAYTRGGAVFLETYGCQMNTNDSEVVLAILQANGYHRTDQLQARPLALVGLVGVWGGGRSASLHPRFANPSSESLSNADILRLDVSRRRT